MSVQGLMVVLVALGGGVGAALRYLVGLAVTRFAGGALLPWGTLTVNLLGCLAIGMLVGHLDGTGLEHARLRAFAVTGVLGGFTTYSTFALDTLRLLEAGSGAGSGGRVALYIGLHLALGMAAVWVGHRLAL